jgi:hypothetical protein
LLRLWLAAPTSTTATSRSAAASRSLRGTKEGATMNGCLLVSLVRLLAAFTLGAVDGLLFHLQRYRLFAHQNRVASTRSIPCVRSWCCRRSHCCTSRTNRALPLACCGLHRADQVALALDVRAEATSRRRFGGLSCCRVSKSTSAANGLHSVRASRSRAGGAVPDALAWSLRRFPRYTALTLPLTTFKAFTRSTRGFRRGRADVQHVALPSSESTYAEP